ncbi:NfeD family protein [Roseivirga pacifica]|uniref:NfeD family protein n=1 Tax=Roseivirga pacifica TaxID=1267423 RepID=UPI003F497BED
MLYIGVTSNTPMGDWISIVLLIVIGIVLIYFELLLVPGTTIVGLVGVVLCVVGIYLTYEKHGDATGNWVLAGSVVLSLIGLFYSFRAKSWEKFSLKTSNRSKVNENYFSDISIGIEGVALSDLKPIGKADFKNKAYEVRSNGGHISSGSQIRVTKVSGNRIVVELITTN